MPSPRSSMTSPTPGRPTSGPSCVRTCWMLDTNTRACGQVVRGSASTRSHISADDAAFAAIDADAASVPGGDRRPALPPLPAGARACAVRGILNLRVHGAACCSPLPPPRPPAVPGRHGAGPARCQDHAARGGCQAFDGPSSSAGTLSPTWLSIVVDVMGAGGEAPTIADASLGAATPAGVGNGRARQPGGERGSAATAYSTSGVPRSGTGSPIR